MFNYYIPAYQRCVQLFFEAKKHPLRNKSLWLKLQEKLILQITRIEKRIRAERAEIKEIKSFLGDRNNNTSKQQATELKAYLDFLKDKIELEYMLLFSYRSIGDGIAFTFIDRHDIKPQAEKETAGFISGKKGNRTERKFLRLAFKLGDVALLNDLTNYLRFSDLTVIEGYYLWYPVEIKSGRSSARNARALRQEIASKKQFEYILNDAIMEIPGTDLKRTRVDPLSRIKDYRSAFNKLLEEAKETGGAGKKMETGLYYFITYTQKVSDNLFKNMGMNQPIHVTLNDYKYNNTLYYPLLMHFDSSERYMEFIKGEVVISIFFEINILTKYAREMGYTFTPEQDKNGAYHFVPDNPEQLTFHASSYAVGKIFFQLYSPRWWVKETISSLNAKYPEQTEA